MGLPTTIETVSIDPNGVPDCVPMRQVPVYLPALFGAVNVIDRSVHLLGTMILPKPDGSPPIRSPPMKTKRYKKTQLQVPLFSTFQTFVNDSPGFITEPSGILSSRIRRRLLQPDPNKAGFAVGVNCVPVAVGDFNTAGRIGFNIGPCVQVGGGVVVIRLMGELVIVGLAVFVTNRACAV